MVMIMGLGELSCLRGLSRISGIVISVLMELVVRSFIVNLVIGKM